MDARFSPEDYDRKSERFLRDAQRVRQEERDRLWRQWPTLSPPLSAAEWADIQSYPADVEEALAMLKQFLMNTDALFANHSYVGLRRPQLVLEGTAATCRGYPSACWGDGRRLGCNLEGEIVNDQGQTGLQFVMDNRAAISLVQSR